MTPPQDVLESLENLIASAARGDLFLPRFIELRDEIKRLRLEVDTLRAERQPFKVLLGEAADAGLFDQPPAHTEVEKRREFFVAQAATVSNARRLAEMLGFKAPERIIDLDLSLPAGKDPAEIKLKWRGVVFAARCYDLTMRPEYIGSVRGNHVIEARLRGFMPRDFDSE